MMGLSKEQLESIQNTPLPPEMQAMIDRSRSDFYAALGPAFDRAIQPYAIVLKMVAHMETQIREQKQKPNRAEKRAEAKKSIKSQSPKKK